MRRVLRSIQASEARKKSEVPSLLLMEPRQAGSIGNSDETRLMTHEGRRRHLGLVWRMKNLGLVLLPAIMLTGCASAEPAADPAPGETVEATPTPTLPELTSE